jgi:hypothetical protein
MNAKRLLLSIVLLLTAFVCSAQINYSYTDPCTGILKTITVPSNGVTVTYYGQIKTFAPADFYSGAFETWSQGVFSSFGNNNPCASVVGLPAAVNVAQNSAINFLGIVNSLSSLADLASGSSNIASSVGSVQNVGGGSDGGKGSSSKSSKNNSNGNTNGNNSSNNGSGSSSGTNSNGSSTNGTGTPNSGSTGQGSNTNPPGSGSTTGGSGSTGSGTTTGNGSNGNSSGTGSSGNGNGTGNGSGSENTQTETEGGGKTNVVGSGVGSVQNSTGGGNGGSKSSGGPTSKNGNRPSILASSDFVGFNFQNSEVKRGGKVSAGYTAMRWDGKRSSGITADYTTAMKGPNVTAFYAFMSKKRIDLISASLTMGFDVKKTTYGTLALGQMWTIKKNVKAVYMLTGSYGNVSETPFIGTAAIAGGMWDVKIKKSIDIKMLFLYVYAPYVSYYNDILLKSPHVVLPIVGTNIGVTKRFKVNINVGGAWALNENALNYTVMMGTRMLL